MIRYLAKFKITATGRPYSGPGLPTRKYERTLDRSTFFIRK